MSNNTSQSLDGKQSEFAAHFYEEINNAMGGTNPNEKLCLLLPGIALTKSDFEYDYKNYIALFDGHVDVKDPEFTLKADRMIIFFENTNEVQRVACTGNVRMTSDDIVIVCGKATYTRLNAHVLLEDEPVVEKGEGEGKQRLTGESIDVWLNDSRVVVNNGVGIEAKTDSFKETQKLPQ